MDEHDPSGERRTADIVLFAVIFFMVVLAATGVILSLPGLAFTAGGVAFLCVLPFLLRDAV